MPTPRELPPKEAAMYKKLLRYYDTKQYKMGLKMCNQILSRPKLAEHGETLAMKGLMLNHLNKKTEAYELVKRGLRADITSHVCWHVNGLLHRSDRNYGQCIKCYTQSLKLNSENKQVLRDLSMMQAQMRDIDGFQSSRAKLMQANPGQEASWVGYSVANHLAGDITNAESIIGCYEKLQIDSAKKEAEDKGLPYRKKKLTKKERHERGQMVQYRLRLLREAGEFERALEYLREQREEYADERRVLEEEVEILLALDRASEACEKADQLLDTNPDNRKFYSYLERAMGMGQGPEYEESRLALYDRKRELFPRALAPVSLALAAASGDTFKARVEAYMRASLRRGVPLFSTLRFLYDDANKVACIESLAFGFVESLTARGRFSDSAADAAEPKEAPSTLIFTRLFLVQHLDSLERYAEALEQADSAIDHTPTLLDLYMAKARVYKHVGDYGEAARLLDYARELDTADRYVNSKCVKYTLRAGDVKRAEELATLFLRESNTSPMEQLSEMQCYWFLTEEASALLANGAVGKALAKLHQVEKGFAQITDDQLDFHGYCVRKVTLSAYLDMMQFGDSLHAQKAYIRAALMAIRTYVQLHDTPLGSDAASALDPKMAGMSAGERKKYLNKQRKAAAKAAAKAKEESKGKGKGKGGGGSSGSEKKDKKGDGTGSNDPDHFAKTKTPLEDALKWLQPLLTVAKDQLAVHLAAVEVHSRRGRPLLVLRAVKRANAIAPNDPRLHLARVHLARMCEKAKEEQSLPPAVLQVVAEEGSKLTHGGQSAAKLQADFVAALSDAPEPLVHALIASRVALLLSPDDSVAAIKLVAGATPGKSCSVSEAAEIYMGTLQMSRGSEEEVTLLATMRDRLHAVFPLAPAFRT